MTTVTVVEPYQVALNGTVYPPGSVVEVPDGIAREWFANGWAAPEPKKTTKARGG